MQQSNQLSLPLGGLAGEGVLAVILRGILPHCQSARLCATKRRCLILVRAGRVLHQRKAFRAASRIGKFRKIRRLAKRPAGM